MKIDIVITYYHHIIYKTLEYALSSGNLDLDFCLFENVPFTDPARIPHRAVSIQERRRFIPNFIYFNIHCFHYLIIRSIFLPVKTLYKSQKVGN